jgi:glyoxylase-like metal-dependent hydrolase (beta-lactamase superfamily II)
VKTQRWQIGECTLTSVVEDEIPRIPVHLFFPAGKPEEVVRHEWLVPEFADEEGRVTLRVQAFVVELRGRKLLIDPCVGNGKQRAMPFWHEKSWPFLERFAEAGFTPDAIDTVIHTHLHADHVGWDTRLEAGAWVPTFRRARHLYTQRELDYLKASPTPGEDVYSDSVAPILAAGLGDVIEENTDLGGGLRLESTPGHTPGHVSLWIESQGQTALVTGDFLHHPVQCAEPHWAEIGDQDAELARTTRRRMLTRAAERNALFVGTHFAARPAGRVRVEGPAFRFFPEG